MPRPSSIKTLPPEVLAQVNRLLTDARWSLDDVVAHLADAGHPRSRSALGRYNQELDQVAERMRRSREMAGALVKEMGPQAAEGKTGRLLVEILQSLVFDHLIKRGDDDAEPTSPMDLMLLAKSIGEMTRALKTDADREAQLKKAGRRSSGTSLPPLRRRRPQRRAARHPSKASIPPPWTGCARSSASGGPPRRKGRGRHERGPTLQAADPPLPLPASLAGGPGPVQDRHVRPPNRQDLDHVPGDRRRLLRSRGGPQAHPLGHPVPRRTPGQGVHGGGRQALHKGPITRSSRGCWRANPAMSSTTSASTTSPIGPWRWCSPAARGSRRCPPTRIRRGASPPTCSSTSSPSTVTAARSGRRSFPSSPPAGGCGSPRRPRAGATSSTS